MLLGLEVELKRYIRNRMWFGYWFSYRWQSWRDHGDELLTRDDGTWQVDHRHHWTPMILVFDTFETLDDSQLSQWALRYDRI